MRAIATITGIVLTIVSAFAVFSFVGWRGALEQEKKALIARDEAKGQREAARSTAYIAHMNLAQREWDDTHVARVLDLFEGERPREGELDLRNFEWYYLNRLCHSDLMTLKGHTGGVDSVAFSPDGRRIASAGGSLLISAASEVKVWDVGTGQESLTFKGHTDSVVSVAFSLDGRRIASWRGSAFGGGQPLFRSP
jgi:eukaryotic-like serine/threonine-protein kinase